MKRPADFDEKWAALVSENRYALRVIDLYMLKRRANYYPQVFWKLSSVYLVWTTVMSLGFGLLMWAASGFVVDRSYAEMGISFGGSMGIFAVIGEIIYRKVYRLPSWKEFCSGDGKVGGE